MNSSSQQWYHPGGKLRELGTEAVSDVELLAIIIGTGIKGKSALNIAKEILNEHESLKKMTNKPLKDFLKFKGLGDVKIIRIAASFELARRIVKEVIKEHGSEKN